MKVAILTIGDEICIGQIVNTNAAWMAAELTRLGIAVEQHSTIGDEDEVIRAELARLLQTADAVLITGGLGPTHDDRTKAVLTAFFDDHLVEDAATLQFLRDLLARRGLEFTERQREQALVPSRARVLTNDHGTAPGMLFETDDGKIVVSMPGVPTEMKHMMTRDVLPLLRERSAADPVNMYRTLLSAGIAEANLADLVGEPETFLGGASLAFLPSIQGVRLRIGVRAANRAAGEEHLNTIETELKRRAGTYLYGRDDESLASKVGELLNKRGLTLAVAESCTGGLLGGAITDIAGSSAWFLGGVLSYSNEVKQAQLGVKAETLAAHGAVSRRTACEMAAGVRNLIGADLSLSVTGVAGPGGGSDEKPVGTVWIGLASAEGVVAKHFLFLKDRRVNRERSVAAALNMLMRELTRETAE